ncbi:MAG TPA: type II toxin-antitoxin system PemK/MazF family toxin [Burkholderiaceae bacterium]|nr:type II toxin-antitoxin system PemK/MazF family toxin [Burkholderiaceae bacterium]
MTQNAYTPDTGHIIELHFEVGADTAAPATRPALVLSPAAYNKRTGLMISCVITNDIKGYPFEVLIRNGSAAVLADQVKSLDWKNTRISPAGRIGRKELTEIRAKLDTLLSAV